MKEMSGMEHLPLIISILTGIFFGLFGVDSFVAWVKSLSFFKRTPDGKKGKPRK